MQEITFDEIVDMVVRVAFRWIVVAFIAGLASGLVIGVLM
jgi:hypothetical protein